MFISDIRTKFRVHYSFDWKENMRSTEYTSFHKIMTFIALQSNITISFIYSVLILEYDKELTIFVLEICIYSTFDVIIHVKQYLFNLFEYILLKVMICIKENKKHIRPIYIHGHYYFLFWSWNLILLSWLSKFEYSST